MSESPSVAPLRVVLFREAQGWLAQGLEHDVGVQAANLKELMLRFALALDVYAEAGTLAALPPSPLYFQVLWPLRAGLFEAEDFAALTQVFDGPVAFAMVA